MEKLSSKVVVADSSPMILFARIDHFFVLNSIFEQVIIPIQVAEECTFDYSRPGAKIIRNAIEKGTISVYEYDINDALFNLPKVLGKGEVAAIQLAYQLKSTLLIDDAWGRKAAENLKIPIIGTAGILLVAKNHGIISKVNPIIYRLKEVGFHLSTEITTKILLLANELN